MTHGKCLSGQGPFHDDGFEEVVLGEHGQEEAENRRLSCEVFNHLIAVNIVNLSVRMSFAEGVEEGLEATHLKVPTGV